MFSNSSLMNLCKESIKVVSLSTNARILSDDVNTSPEHSDVKAANRTNDVDLKIVLCWLCKRSFTVVIAIDEVSGYLDRDGEKFYQ
ncbi:hypothetical protein ACOMHN_020603 [Nucella lapillus]